MRKNLFYFFNITVLLGILLIFNACKRVPEPVACFEVEKTSYDLGEPIHFSSACSENATAFRWQFGYGGEHHVHSGCESSTEETNPVWIPCMPLDLHVDFSAWNKREESDDKKMVIKINHVCYECTRDNESNAYKTLCSEDHMNWWHLKEKIDEEEAKTGVSCVKK